MLFTIVIVAKSDVYLPASVIYDAIYGIFVFRSHFPVFGKVISDTVGNDTYGDFSFIFCIGRHDTVDGVV